MAQVRKVEGARGATRWRLRVYVGRDPDTGKRTIITRTFGRKQDAEREARRLERQKDLGALTTPSKEPLARYLDRWLNEVKEGRVRARTLDDYRGVIRRYIADPPSGTPPIGSVRLDRLTPSAFQALYAHLWRERGLAPRTLTYLHSVVRQALGHAVQLGALARNPTDHVRPPRQPREGQERRQKPMRAMSKEEAGRFLTASKTDRYYALWAVLLTGGLRPGEALGLTWDDVDLGCGSLHIRRALTRRGADASWNLVEPKTTRARRTVVLPGLTTRALRDHRRAQAEERLGAGPRYADYGEPAGAASGFVFANELGAPLHGANLYARNFRRIMAAAKLGEWVGEKSERRFRPAFRMYDLRHTCATLLLLAGENPKVVSERLGHASVTLTLDTYSHVLPAMQEASAEKLEAMFGGG